MVEGSEQDAGSLEEVYHKYKNQIYHYLYRSTLNRHTAEELTQDTFLKAFKAFSQYRAKASIKTWLYVIARNTYLDYAQKKERQPEEQVDPTEWQFTDETDAFEASQERMVIRKIMRQLPEKARTLLILRDQNGLSYKEIASIVGDTEGQVKIGLHRARKFFREKYELESKEDPS
jgi:RNA polymerase sigma-70 factor (ECF subfamily)